MSDVTVAAGDWRCAAASVRGASHHRTGRPNQDAAAATLDESGLLILAVADGHGSAPHARSDQGSRFAIDAAVAAVRRLADGGAVDPAEIEALPAQIVADWREAVAAALRAAPLTAEEAQRIAAIRLDDSAAYGATLVLAVLHPRFGCLVQIGDGDIHLVDTTGKISKPLPDEDAPGEATSSLCLPQAEARARVRVLDAAEVAEVSAVVASTDGLVKSYNDERAVRSSVTALAARLAGGAEEQFVVEVSSWLPQVSSAGSGDDISIAVAARTMADEAWVAPGEPPAEEAATTVARRKDELAAQAVVTPPVVAPAVVTPPAGTNGTTTTPAGAPAAWIVAAVLVLLAGAAGYVWRDALSAMVARWTAVPTPAPQPAPAPAPTPTPTPTQAPAPAAPVPPAASPAEPAAVQPPAPEPAPPAASPAAPVPARPPAAAPAVAPADATTPAAEPEP